MLSCLGGGDSQQGVPGGGEIDDMVPNIIWWQARFVSQTDPI